MIRKINERDSQWDSLTDDQIKAKTPEFQARIAAGETVDALLPEAFAAVKQACKRMKGTVCLVKGQEVVWDMVPYDVQLLGGIVLHNGTIAEMKTGEGKTLVATLPVYLNALAGKGVHVVTVNDYLASRDSEWMAYLYAWLGLTTGSITKKTPLHVRRAEYEKDITYVENSELGFDYLRDNLVRSNKDRQLLFRPLHFAIVDEVDSILIDEARTPLIISYPSDEATEKYAYYSQIVRSLKPCSKKKKVSKGLIGDMLSGDEKHEEDGDYYIDEKNKNVTLSGLGIANLEQMIGVENIYKDLGYDEIHHIENALRAWAVYENNKDYIIVNGEVLIVDEHTGRTMPGRRYSEGLHQAIEAKEKVTIQKESKTMATITYQNFFKLYTKLCGMTGTATTEGEEFEKIYSLEVLSIPTNKPTIRVDQNDKVFFNQNAKWAAVVDYIRFYHEAGVPILLGTSSIHTSEYVSDLLRKLNIQHYVLNAKFHEQEAEIITNAGRHNSVVVATNMAGRGTDIKLEKGLHDKVAAGYADYVMQMISGDTFSKKAPVGVSCTIASSQEYEYTINALQQKLSLTDENIRAATGAWIDTPRCRLKITLNTASKKSKKEGAAYKAFGEIIVAPVGVQKPELIERDLHYGLFILGSEKHESRRIDNQLRGRAGRQGDPGTSVFFVALDDEIMRKMGGEKIQSVARMLLPSDQLEKLELTQSQFTNSIIRAQKQMEGWNFSIRKHLFDYDSVINRQRQRIYAKRDEMIELETRQPEMVKDGMTPTMREVFAFIPEVVDGLLAQYSAIDADADTAAANLQQEFGIAEKIELPADKKARRAAIITYLETLYNSRLMGADLRGVDATVRMIYLGTIDKYWVEHIDAMQYLRDKVSLYGYAQQDPLIMYKHEAFTKFTQLLASIKQEALAIALRTDFVQASYEHAAMQESNEEHQILVKLEQAAAAAPAPVAPAYDARVMAQRGFDANAQRFAQAFGSDDGVEVIDGNASGSAAGSTAAKTYGRNDLVKIVGPNGEVQEMKYKKAEELLSKGWKLQG